MKKYFLLVVFFASCGGEGGGSPAATGSTAEAATQPETTNETPITPAVATQLENMLAGHWTLQSTDCQVLGVDTGDNIVKTGEGTSTDGLNSMIEVYRMETDTPSQFSNANDVRFNLDQDIIGDCVLPDVVADWNNCLIVCLGGVTADRTRIDWVCDDGLSGGVCYLVETKD